jgi:hypothetical protein
VHSSTSSSQISSSGISASCSIGEGSRSGLVRGGRKTLRYPGNRLSPSNMQAGRTVLSFVRVESRTVRTHLTERGGTECSAVARPAKSPISNRSGRASRPTRSSNDLRGRPPLQLHDARRLRPVRPRRGDPAGTRPMAPAYARAARRRGAGRLARRPQRRLSARRTDDRRAPRRRRRISRTAADALSGPQLEEHPTERQRKLRLVGGRRSAAAGMRPRAVRSAEVVIEAAAART